MSTPHKPGQADQTETFGISPERQHYLMETALDRAQANMKRWKKDPEIRRALRKAPGSASVHPKRGDPNDQA